MFDIPTPIGLTFYEGSDTLVKRYALVVPLTYALNT